MGIPLSPPDPVPNSVCYILTGGFPDRMSAFKHGGLFPLLSQSVIIFKIADRLNTTVFVHASKQHFEMCPCLKA